MAREDRLISKVNRIEEKMMQKELYNYTNIQQQIKRKKDAAAAALRSKEEEENMVPSMFQDQADESDQYDSCGEADQASAGRSKEGQTSNPFQDFDDQVNHIEDENLRLSLTLIRKMIVDYIEGQVDTDYEEWRVYQSLPTTMAKEELTL